MPPRVILNKPASNLPRPHMQAGPPVNQETCDESLQSAIQNARGRDFFAIYDLVGQNIRFINTEGKLDLPESPKDYPNAIATGVQDFLREWYQAFTDAAMHVMARHRVLLHPGSFMIRFPLKLQHLDRPQLIIQTIYPFQLDVDGNILSFFAHYFISGDYLWEPLSPTLQDYPTADKTNMLKEIWEEIYPWMTLEPGANLAPRHFAITDNIQALQEKPIHIVPNTGTHHILTTNSGKPSPESTYRYLNEILKILTQLFTDITGDPPLPLFLQGTDALRIILFCQASGILDLLRHYYDHSPVAR